MSKTLVINLTRTTLYVDVRHEDQTLDAVKIAPQSRVSLRAGMVVDKRWLQQNQGLVKVVAPVETTAPTSTVAAPAAPSSPVPDTDDYEQEPLHDSTGGE